MPLAAESTRLGHSPRGTSRTASRTPLARIRDRSGVVGVVVLTVLLYGAVVVGRLAFHSWNPTFFIHTGARFYDQLRSPEVLWVRERTGYDGQFYYRFAVDPLSKERSAHGMTIDTPAYRGQRILYPVIVHLLACGRTAWIPWSMIVVNYLAVCGLAFGAAKFAEQFAIPARYGLAIPLLPPVLLGLVRDLADPLAISLIVLALLFIHSRRIKSGAFILVLAILTRETMVLLAGALFVHSAWRSMRKQAAWTDSVALMIPLVAYVVVQLWIFSRWGEYAFITGQGNFVRYPFSSMLSFTIWAARIVRAPSLPSLLYHVVVVSELLFVGELIMLAALVLSRSAVATGIKLGWLSYLWLAAFFSNLIWVEDWSFMRACGEVMVISLIIVMGARTERPLRIALASTIGMWVLLACRAIVKQ